MLEHESMKCIVATTLLVLTAQAMELKPRTVEAFERYIRATEQRLDARTTFLWADESAERARQARAGQVVVRPFGAKPTIEVPDGIIHDWVGTIFIPGATVKATVALVQDYNRHKEYYKPEVLESRILSHNGEDFRVFLRLRKTQV